MISISLKNIRLRSLEERKTRKGTMLRDDFDINTIISDLSFFLKSIVISLNQLSETEFSGYKNLLTTRELELRTTERFLSVLNIFGSCTDWHKNLTNADTSRFTESFTISLSHTLLKSICSSARKHFIDTNDVPWMDSHSHMETFSSNTGLHVLVASNTGSFKSFRGDLFFFVTNQMNAGWKSVVACLLFTNIINSDLWVGYSTIETRLWIRLVLLITIAPGGSSSHFLSINNN